MPWFDLIAYFATPLVAAWLVERKGLSWLDPVLTCYGVGLLLANLPIELDTSATQMVTEAVVPLAIPLLLFKTDFVKWARTSKQTIIGFVIAVVSALVSLSVATALFRGTPDLWYVTGMLSGTWTGGSPNLVSVAAALEAPEQVVVLTNAADIFVGGIYLFALLTFARPLLSHVLPAPETVAPFVLDAPDDTALATRVKDGFVSFLVAATIVGLSVGASLILFGGISAPAVILGITSLGIAASFVEQIRRLTMGYEIGNYLILVFCTAIGALTDLGELMNSGTTLLGFTATALGLALVLHYGACKVARIDVDTAIITSVATVMGPPLVVPVAKRLNSRDALVSGITTGLVGYALANYVGIAMANLAKALL